MKKHIKYLIGIPLGLLVAWIVFWAIFRMGFNEGIKFANKLDKIQADYRLPMTNDAHTISLATSNASPTNTLSSNSESKDGK